MPRDRLGACDCPTRAKGGSSVGRDRLAGGANELVCLEQDMVRLRLRPDKKTDGDKGGAEQKSDQHDPAMRWPVSIVK
jgi:hypothetical protein